MAIFQKWHKESETNTLASLFIIKYELMWHNHKKLDIKLSNLYAHKGVHGPHRSPRSLTQSIKELKKLNKKQSSVPTLLLLAELIILEINYCPVLDKAKVGLVLTAGIISVFAMGGAIIMAMGYKGSYPDELKSEYCDFLARLLMKDENMRLQVSNGLDKDDHGLFILSSRVLSRVSVATLTSKQYCPPFLKFVQKFVRITVLQMLRRVLKNLAKWQKLRVLKKNVAKR